jgi:TonB family protein
MHEERPRTGRPCAPDRRLARAGLSCLASLAVHGVAVTTLYGMGVFSAPSSPRPRPWAVALEALTPSQWQANRGISGAVSAPGAALPTREEPRQVVELPPDVATDPMRAERPPPAGALYLAERDQTVERQTISRHADTTHKLLRVPQDERKARRGSGERGPHKVAIPGRTGPKGGGGTDADAAAPQRLQPEEHAQPDPAAPGELARTEATAEPGLPPVDSALPSDGEGGQRIDGRRISGMPLQEYETPEGGPNYDGLGLDEGAETRLHTRRFAPAAYWTDVRARIQDDWHRRALSLLQQYDPHEDTYFYKPRTVRIAVTLDANGSVRDVHVVESSRLEFYDAIALAVVKDKQPYPPPPPAAIRSDGNARINMAFTWLPSTRQLR